MAIKWAGNLKWMRMDKFFSFHEGAHFQNREIRPGIILILDWTTEAGGRFEYRSVIGTTVFLFVTQRGFNRPVTCNDGLLQPIKQHLISSVINFLLSEQKN